MKSKEYRDKIYRDSPDVEFEYDNKACGLTPIFENGVQRYEAWFGKELKVYYSLDEYLKDPFYNNKSMIELIEENLIEPDYF